MRDPYEERTREAGRSAVSRRCPPGQFTRRLSCTTFGWRCSRCVGDAAIDEVLTGYEAANAEASIFGKRWGIEHAFIGALTICRA